ncbi:efflux RND transporter periplasmic adaptor subunit [Pleomorphomonas oryzae]|uniref:efflux RND transporter periplasmic adaptor subunit n=1 Tax=Pleomorphomonas oryzae TaxID=261934 RepID=UPI00040C0AC2|nr:efflux RND transporter periplasmic adaptor subunit [Pleomorphomonas oryzae]
MFKVEAGHRRVHVAGMNTLTEHDRQLTEALKSLSLAPMPETPAPRRKAIRWVAGVVVVAVPVVAVLVWPGTFGDIRAVLQGQPDAARLAAPATVLSAAPDASSPPAKAPAAAREMTGSGYVIAPRLTHVFAKYEGRITGISVDVGDRVEAGQLLVTLDNVSARLALEQAKAAKVSADLVVAARQIALAQAVATLRRSEILARSEATSKKDLEEAETGWKSALNAVAQGRQEAVRADLAIRVAEEQLDEMTVRAPFAGTVTQLNAHIGDTVLARTDSVRESQSLLALTDTTGLVIDADVAETNLPWLRAGLRGEAVLDGFPDRPFAVELQRIAPVASAEKGTIGLRLILVDPPDGLRPNMAARIRIAVPETPGTMGEALP